MQAGHYASLWNDVDLLEHCYRWLALHYVERGDTNSIIATGDALKQGAFSIPYSSILLAGTRSHARTVLLTQYVVRPSRLKWICSPTISCQATERKVLRACGALPGPPIVHAVPER